MTPNAKSLALRFRDNLVMALRFFSRLPTGGGPHERPELGRIAVVLPLAAVIMGISPVAVLVGGAALGLPAYSAATLSVAAMVVIGGAMMEDALADAADGLFGGHTRLRRLEILKDSRHGSYGVAALCLFLLLRVSALGSIIAIDPLLAGLVWLSANVAGRSASLWLAVDLPLARPEGAAATVGALPRRQFIVGAALAALLVFLGAPTLGVLIALPVLALVVWSWGRLCHRLVGGQTGDLIGAAAALGEITVLTVLLIFV
ncbi:adenosylcobinamide-GDP ribazoletransferase [Devosia rhizoryzae]|uniref:adenosylcobinamide-GDP ribazoletransferase n=1 Tax=Devosia rhizoryzae TaxID=2774137 RepID=UPI001AEEBD87|nr:adenosylcobinamide-GDP ribazoletransferase [Devosia rhizoryzae]